MFTISLFFECEYQFLVDELKGAYNSHILIIMPNRNYILALLLLLLIAPSFTQG